MVIIDEKFAYVSQINVFHIALIIDVMQGALFAFAIIKPNPIMQPGNGIILDFIHENVLEGRTSNFTLTARIQIEPNGLQ